ncbi:MAG TPA: glycosyltransferase [Chthoniobacterales bacterium]|jgi:UDP-N-acetylglucosamine:LPS N-acetylglucosamine transferase
MKKILILTAGYGEGHNSAARGIRDGLARLAPTASVEMHDLFIETYGLLNEAVRKGYAALINRWPRSWGFVYRWLDKKKDFARDFQKFGKLKRQLSSLLDTYQPDIIVSVFPAYPYLLAQITGQTLRWKNVVVVTDSITINAIWYGSTADYFLVPNQESAAVIRSGGVPEEITRVFGFPVSPNFADLADRVASIPPETKKKVLYVVNPPSLSSLDLIRRLLQLDIDLTVTVGRNEKLRSAVEAAAAGRRIEIFGWTDQLPRLFAESQLLIGKAGGATVQEAIAAACPMIINHVVSGQEEGNARLIVQTNSGAIALSSDGVIAEIERAFGNGGQQWQIWKNNISKMSRPRASLDIAEFLMAL